jgi:transposase-like protein
MARPRGRIDVTCQNEECEYYLIEESKDIVKRGKYRTGHQRYFCKHCSTFFMETKGGPLYRKHLTKTETISICKLVIEKNGIRSMERITGHHRDTIGRLLDDLAKHSSQVNETLLKDVNLDKFEADEFWSFVKKNKKKLSREAESSLLKVMRGHTQS